MSELEQKSEFGEVKSSKETDTGVQVFKKVKEKVELVKYNENDNRIIPKLIIELINHGFEIKITQSGYELEGFYGLNNNGYAVIVEAKINDGDIQLISYDNKKKFHILNTFDDVVNFNHLIFKNFFKSKNYTLNDKWLEELMKRKLLSVSPV